jgi:hypothetical protein
MNFLCNFAIGYAIVWAGVSRRKKEMGVKVRVAKRVRDCRGSRRLVLAPLAP